MGTIEDADANHATPVLEHVVTLCGNGTCPTVYRTDRGTYVIQGYPVQGDGLDIAVGPGELLVEVPAELLASAVRSDN